MRGCSFWLVVERDPIAFLKFRHGSQVNDEKIHRYTAYYRQPDSFHHHCSAVGKTAKIAIGITNIDGAKLHVALGGSRCIISNAFASKRCLALKDLRFWKGDLSNMPSRLCSGYAAIQRKARPCQIKGIIMAKADACTVRQRSEEHTSELQSLMRISYAVFCLKKKKHT